MPDYHIDTKSKIFNTALRLFAIRGVENVSMREIADAVGIKAASIYNHYENKEEIVEACYDFFLKNHDIGRLNKIEYLPVIKHGTKREVLDAIFTPLPKDKAEKVILSMIVTFSRIYSDDKARECYMKMINHSMRFLRDFFEAAIEIKRFREFNIKGVSMSFLSAKMLAAQSVSLCSEEAPDWPQLQAEMFSVLADLLPFRY